VEEYTALDTDQVPQFLRSFATQALQGLQYLKKNLKIYRKYQEQLNNERRATVLLSLPRLAFGEITGVVLYSVQ
jgi:hypothetical protein